ncbi:MAG: trigger factor, partial [Firmicutes bacterium]|nr:trigger factor [Bacillota bacterium]
KSFIPGFEEKLIGVKAEEERDLDQTIPENNHAADLAGKAVVFHVKCNEVKFEELPELDDEFAQDNDFDTMEAMRKDAHDRLFKSKETVADNAFTDRLVNAAVANMTVDIPESMIEEHMDSLMDEYSRYITSQGIPFDQYLKMMGSDPASFRATTRPAAETQTRTELLLDAVVKAEALEVTEEDVEAEIEKMAAEYNMKAENLKKLVNVEALKEDLLRRKATAVIHDSGIPTAPKAEEPAPEEKAEAAEE